MVVFCLSALEHGFIWKQGQSVDMRAGPFTCVRCVRQGSHAADAIACAYRPNMEHECLAYSNLKRWAEPRQQTGQRPMLRTITQPP